MKLFGIRNRKAEKAAAGEHRKASDTKELEIYSGMRVLVENLEGKLLFIAKLQDPHSHIAELCQYSEMGAFQDLDTENLLDATPVPVKLRGYNENKRTAVFMEGNMSPRRKHVWQLENLSVTAIENERSYPRLNTDMDAAIMTSDKADAEELPCKLINISVGGAGIGLGHRFYKGDKFFLKAKLFEDSRNFVVYCEVLRVIEKDVSQFEYGCQFLELAEAGQEQITRLVEQAGRAS